MNLRHATSYVRIRGATDGDNILTEFGIPMKLERLIEMCLNETYNGVPVG